MPSTYEPIATTTLGSAQSAITFGSGGTIPQTYTDLVLMGNGIASGDAGINIRFNGDSGSNYSYTFMYGDGTSAVSGRDSNVTAASGGRLGVNGAASTFQIMNYSNTTTNKTMLSRGDNASVLTITIVSLWRSTSAITSLTMTRGNGGDFSAGSTFTLYGIKAA